MTLRMAGFAILLAVFLLVGGLGYLASQTPMTLARIAEKADGFAYANLCGRPTKDLHLFRAAVRSFPGLIEDADYPSWKRIVELAGEAASNEKPQVKFQAQYLAAVMAKWAKAYAQDHHKLYESRQVKQDTVQAAVAGLLTGSKRAFNIPRGACPPPFRF